MLFNEILGNSNIKNVLWKNEIRNIQSLHKFTK